MRFVQTGVLLLGGAMYFLVDAYANQPTNESDEWITQGNNLLLIFIGWNLVLLAAFILSLVDAVRKSRARKTRALGTGAMVVKLAGIPYFVFNFIAIAFVAVVGSVFVFMIGPLLFIFIVVGIVLTYLTMTSTSVYGWAAVATLRRERTINTALAVVYSILLLGFFTDIVAGVMLFGHSRRRPRLALVVMALVVGVVLIALGLFGIFTLPEVAHSLDLPPAFYAFGAVPIVLLGIGIVVVVGTVILSVALRSSLRAEAQQAALARARRDEPDAATTVDAPAEVVSN